MALTADQARLVGELQTKIDMLSGYVANLSAAVQAGGTIEWAAVRMGVEDTPVSLETPMQMDAEDSATVLEALIGVYQKNIDALQAQLNTIS